MNYSKRCITNDLPQTTTATTTEAAAATTNFNWPNEEVPDAPTFQVLSLSLSLGLTHTQNAAFGMVRDADKEVAAAAAPAAAFPCPTTQRQGHKIIFRSVFHECHT